MTSHNDSKEPKAPKRAVCARKEWSKEKLSFKQIPERGEKWSGKPFKPMVVQIMRNKPKTREERCWDNLPLNQNTGGI